MVLVLLLSLFGFGLLSVCDVYGYVLSGKLCSYPFVDYFCVSLLFDSLGWLSGYMLLLCSFVALCYCYYYMGSSKYLSLFFLMLWFVVVMLLLVFSGSLLLTLFLWEYLAMVSFLLILYYSTMSSLRAAVITIFASRFGDISLFFLLVWWVNLWDFSSLCPVLCVFMVVMSKSAGFPFIPWLLEAMRAPTPVSSLVHSSTLVAAGVWFLLRYPGVCEGSLWLLFSASLVGIVFSGFCALVYDDLKKIVALSTCSNICWCLVYYVCGDWWLALLQLIVHGVCKCLLFTAVGDLMVMSGGAQSMVGVNTLFYGDYFGMVRSVLVFSLCGLPFLGVFFGKHAFFVLNVYCFSCLDLFMLFFSLFLSYAYTFRFFWVLFGVGVGLSSCFGYNFSFQYLLILLGTLIGWGGSLMLSECVVFSWFWGVVFLFCQVAGAVLGLLICRHGVFRLFMLPAVMFGGDFVVLCLYKLGSSVSFFLNFVLYRWEVGLFGFISRWLGSKRVFESYMSMLSMEFMILGSVLLFSFLYIFC